MKKISQYFSVLLLCLTINQLFGCETTNNNANADRLKIEALYNNLQKVTVLSDEHCLNNLQEAIHLIKTKPGKDGLTGEDIANYLANAINSGELELHLNKELTIVGGVVAHFETKKLSVNCAHPINIIANNLVHEFTHVLINRDLVAIGDSHKKMFESGKTNFINLTVDPAHITKISDQEWVNMLLFAFNGIFQEISAYSTASSIVEDEFTDNPAALLEHLNKHYILPRYKFALSKETFDSMVSFIERSEDDKSIKETYTMFVSHFMKSHGVSFKKAIIFWAQQKR